MDKNQKRLSDKEKNRQAMVDTALSALLAKREGREFVWWLLEIGRVAQQPFTVDPYRTAFLCGELNVGQQILARLLEKFPEGYLEILQEKNEDGRREREYAAEQRRARDNDESEDAGGASELALRYPDSLDSGANSDAS